MGVVEHVKPAALGSERPKTTVQMKRGGIEAV